MSWLRESPSYFRFYNSTIRLEESPGGRAVGWKLNIDTGFFEPTSSEDVYNVLSARADSDFSILSEEEFVKETEDARRLYLRGEGSVFDIYRRIGEIFDGARKQGRRIEPAEKEEISSLRRRSFQLWEEESARLAAGESPTFRPASTGNV